MLNKNRMIYGGIDFIFMSILAGSACGIAFALCFAIWKKASTFKKEEGPTTNEVFKWVLIGALFGGCLASIFIKG